MELSKTLQNYKLIRYVFLIILGTFLLTISAKIKIPFYPVPMTMQTFIVLILGISLGSKLGSLTVLVYLVEGIFGLPVFSNSPEKGIGIAYFTGPTMGYLIGFIVAAFIAGKINLKMNIFKIIQVILISITSIYFLGMLWLGYIIGWDKPIFELGAKPFLLAELFKIILLILVTKYCLKFKKLI
ncbi:MAG: biotin transporter BioY [Candidatus Pelagibacter sp. TMED118]|nr:MAG: biotin transporter BioY [Candidatus Pelagibacter sp. TMED118]|tara:strand:+ start:3443 stop:3994 length:552 start_codon:yes stop_codon:yes gene_type:complete